MIWKVIAQDALYCLHGENAVGNPGSKQIGFIAGEEKGLGKMIKPMKVISGREMFLGA
jgi:hypothetical protein